MRGRGESRYISGSVGGGVVFVVVLAVSLLGTRTVALQRLEDIENAIASDVFPFDACRRDGTGRTHFSYAYPGDDPVNTWDNTTAQFERDAFFASFGHTDISINRTWDVKIGPGGSIYSYVLEPIGELMPPQFHENAPWIDEVWQMVAVNGPLAHTPGASWFIHQAGAYQRDGPSLDNVPFYSPSLASTCQNSTCTFISWGQQAHVPTNWTSNAMYLTRYADCGNGVMEVTYMIHNFGNSGSEAFTYNNVPWGGVRTSSLRDALVAPANGANAELLSPIPGFGASDMYVENIRDHGGYAIFAQEIRTPAAAFEMPCADDSGNVLDCSNANARPLVLEPTGEPAWHSVGHTSTWGKYTVAMRIRQIQNTASYGCRTSCALTFTNNRTEQSVSVDGILHWAWNGNTLYFFLPDDRGSTDVNEVNQKLAIDGDRILVTVRELSYLSDEDNLGLAFVFGIDKERDDPTILNAGDRNWLGSPSRLRIGSTNTVRDYTVFTINRLLDIEPGHTYFDRQYVLADRYVNLDATARTLANRSYQGVIFPGDAFARSQNVSLYVTSDYPNSFGACDSDSDSRTLACRGTTTPGNESSKPLFYITCPDGTNKSYVGHDPYGLSSSQSEARRPWFCSDIDDDIRPTWHILGFFPHESCSSLERLRFDMRVCDESPVTTTLGPAELRTTEGSTTEGSTTLSDSAEGNGSSASSTTGLSASVSIVIGIGGLLLIIFAGGCLYVTLRKHGRTTGVDDTKKSQHRRGEIELGS